MEYRPGSTTTDMYQNMVYAAAPIQNGWTEMPQYPVMAYTVPPHVDQIYTQPSAVAPVHTIACESPDSRQGYQVSQGQLMAYLGGGETDYGHRLSPAVEVDVEELLEYERRRSSASTDDKEPLTPAQRRRKAQNRAAQRAFRDRKRQRVQDLEAQLNLLESRTDLLELDNKRLKHDLLTAQTENSLLRNIASSNAPNVTVHLDALGGRRGGEGKIAQDLPRG